MAEIFRQQCPVAPYAVVNGDKAPRSMPLSKSRWKLPRRKLDHEKIRASLNVKCPRCGAELPPDKQVRIDFEHLQCPTCGQTFTPEKRQQA
jgi:uncharacterized protein (UPF0212 family)